MIPLGYIYKPTGPLALWFNHAHILDVCSVSNCIFKSCAEHIPFWELNGYCFFNSPEEMNEKLRKHQAAVTRMPLFYYEGYELEFDEQQNTWNPYNPIAEFPTSVVVPEQKSLLGFDVVTFSCRTSPECSPLSCCNLADSCTVNEHCLFPERADAIAALKNGVFTHSEPGPFRILAVYHPARPPA